MRRVNLIAFVLLPVLAHAQATVQNSNTNAGQPSAVLQAPTLQAKNAVPAGLRPVAANGKSSAVAITSTQLPVPVHEIIIERPVDQMVETNSGSLTYDFFGADSAVTVPKLVQTAPLGLTLGDIASEGPVAVVSLSMTVDKNGVPQNIVVTHSGGAALDRRALQAVSKYRFKPAAQGNFPVEAPITIEIKIKQS